MEKSGKAMGVPYDFRMPTLERIKERMWNPDDERIIVPRVFGVGWTLNLAQLKRKNAPLFWLAIALYSLALVSIIRTLVKSLRELKSG